MWSRFLQWRKEKLPFLDSLYVERARILAERKAGRLPPAKSRFRTDSTIRANPLTAQDLDNFRMIIASLPEINRERQSQRDIIELTLKETSLNPMKRLVLERDLKSGPLQIRAIPVGTASGLDSPLTPDAAVLNRAILEEHVQRRARYMLTAVHEHYLSTHPDVPDEPGANPIELWVDSVSGGLKELAVNFFAVQKRLYINAEKQAIREFMRTESTDSKQFNTELKVLSARHEREMAELQHKRKSAAANAKAESEAKLKPNASSPATDTQSKSWLQSYIDARRPLPWEQSELETVEQWEEAISPEETKKYFADAKAMETRHEQELAALTAKYETGESTYDVSHFGTEPYTPLQTYRYLESMADSIEGITPLRVTRTSALMQARERWRKAGRPHFDGFVSNSNTSKTDSGGSGSGSVSSRWKSKIRAQSDQIESREEAKRIEIEHARRAKRQSAPPVGSSKDFPLSFRLKLGESTLPGAGTGVHLIGRAKAGEVVAFHHGLVYANNEFAEAPGGDKIAQYNVRHPLPNGQSNGYAIQRFDQMLIDGSVDPLTCVREDDVNGFRVDTARPLPATRPNPYALGAWINHPPPGIDQRPNSKYSDAALTQLGFANVLPYGINFPKSLYRPYPVLLRYIPNKYYTSPHSTSGSGKGEASVFQASSIVYIATRDINDEELFVNYRYNPNAILPSWYHPALDTSPDVLKSYGGGAGVGFFRDRFYFPPSNSAVTPPLQPNARTQ